jgi:hypothetical protein
VDGNSLRRRKGVPHVPPFRERGYQTDPLCRGERGSLTYPQTPERGYSTDPPKTLKNTTKDQLHPLNDQKHLPAVRSLLAELEGGNDGRRHVDKRKLISPMRYEIRPLGHWTDPETPDRTRAFFRAGWANTLEMLGREAGWLGAPLLVMQVDVTEGEIRRDGMLRANAKVGHPGVVISFNSEYGPLRYATDQFIGWQDNVRGIALALGALRAVDRYGVTKRGEQYTGWKALAAPVAGFATADEALRWMREQARPHAQDVQSATPRELYRFLARRFHPDAGGSPDDWHRLDEARQLLHLTGSASS